MSPTRTLLEPTERTSLRLSAVDWRTYSQFLRIFAERPGYRLTYDRGELEIMSPLLEHDKDGRFLGRLAVTLTEELGLPVIGGGSVTMRRRGKQRGLEPDDCFWIGNAARMAGRRRLDLRRDPPPDLAIEADVTHSSLNRLKIYSVLRVPEVWRLIGDTLTFLVLGLNGEYQQAAFSRSFPMVTPADLLVFLQQVREAPDQNAVVREFRAWIRQRLAAPSTGAT
jgi:Uma2 family endonuclease